MRHPQIQQMIHTGRDLAFAAKRGSALSKRLIGSARAHSGVLAVRKVLNMRFPDDRLGRRLGKRIVILIPALRIGRFKINDHRAETVGTGRPGVRIGRLAHHAVDIDKEGIVDPGPVSFFSQCPDSG